MHVTTQQTRMRLLHRYLFLPTRRSPGFVRAMSFQQAVPSQSPVDGSTSNSKSAGMQSKSFCPRVQVLMTPLPSQEGGQEGGQEVREGGKTCGQDHERHYKSHRWREKSKGREGEAGRTRIREHHPAWQEER